MANSDKDGGVQDQGCDCGYCGQKVTELRMRRELTMANDPDKDAVDS